MSLADQTLIQKRVTKLIHLGLIALIGALLLVVALLTLSNHSPVAHAQGITPSHTIPPAEGGRPKFDSSIKTVTPPLASTGGETLFYTIIISNSGAYTAGNTTLSDVIPAGATYNGDVQASSGSPNFAGGTLTWAGVVGFDSTVVVSFSVTVSPTFSGIMRNTAVISDPLLDDPVSVTADAAVTDNPILAIAKTATPSKPGANKTLTYTLVVTNQGQPVTGLSITVTDQVPANTTLRDMGPDGLTSVISDVVTWTRSVNLAFGEATTFTFSVDIDNVPEGTIINNAAYQVASAVTGVTVGEAYTVTVVKPSLKLFKEVSPDPPGSNREMTYTLIVLNQGSLATNLVITDVVPAGVTYERGGLETGGVVSWTWPSLDTGETAFFTFTGSISDIKDVAIVNGDYAVCSAEGVCQAGDVLTKTVGGPTFEVFASLDPLVKKPGGGPSTAVTPTLVVRNVGPGNAIDATVLLEFIRISVSANDLFADPAIGTLPPFPALDCGKKCVSYLWVGSLNVGQTITFTTIEGQSTIGGAEGTNITATITITDELSNMTTEPVSATAVGTVTHLANLIATKSAPTVVGPGQLFNYTITVINTGLATDDPPFPWLIDVVPTNTTVVNISDGGLTETLTGTTVVSWTLPKMGTGDSLTRSFTVRADDNLVSGTHIVNSDYQTFWVEAEDNAVFTYTGQAITTTVQAVGLIDSFKEVTPTLASAGDTLIFLVHIVNSSGVALAGVTVDDLLPWEDTTYQFDAVASGGGINEHDIVSVHWTGNVDAFSSVTITLSVVIDPDFQGAITNTATISHPDLLSEIKRAAVAYVTDEPVLRITKSASPNPVKLDAELLYTIKVENLGRRATFLLITDTIPANTGYVVNSASAGGQLVGNQIQWQILELDVGESKTFEFRVKVGSGTEVVNNQYGVTSAEGVSAVGSPVVTTITQDPKGSGDIYLPILLKN